MSKGIEEILKDRQKDYGDAKDSWERIGRGWGAILKIDDIPAPVVGLMMDFLKTIRLAKNISHIDSWDDKDGYTELAREIVMEDLNEHQE